MIKSDQQHGHFGSRVLAPWAAKSAETRGRQFDEPQSPTRSAFQRDRDRVIHAASFRRLQYKTQVFVEHEGDHFRTRLTHTLEVAQIARSLARALGLDEDLAETIALAHDLGHSPFGHAGERALDRVMQPYGGFDHNAQSLRMVTRLEARYAGFDGLNLTWESLEGLVKHNGPLRGTLAPLDAQIPAPILEFNTVMDLELDQFSSLEAQVAALADDIAYNSHDVDDGVRAGLFSLDDLAGQVPLIGALIDEIDASHPHLDPSRRVHEVVRRMITNAVNDCLSATFEALQANGINAPEQARHFGEPLSRHSSDHTTGTAAVRRFLFTNMYRSPKVFDVMLQAERIVEEMFLALFEKPSRLPPDWAQQVEGRLEDQHFVARKVADYIAGMTDRFALAEYDRLFDQKVDLR